MGHWAWLIGDSLKPGHWGLGLARSLPHGRGSARLRIGDCSLDILWNLVIEYWVLPIRSLTVAALLDWHWSFLSAASFRHDNFQQAAILARKWSIGLLMHRAGCCWQR